MRRLALLALLLTAAPALAQTGSLEDRLRGELRATKAQLDAAQAQTQPLKARAEAAEKARDALKAQLAKARTAASAAPSAAEKARIATLQADLAALRAGANSGSSADPAKLAEAQTQLKSALDAVSAMRAERDRAVAAAKAQADTSGQTTALLAAAQAKNARLIALSREILGRYARVGVGTYIAAREPFIARRRVAIENEAEKLGDQIYANKYDSRADTPKPAPDPAATPKP